MALATDILPMVIAADEVSGVPQGQWTYQDYAAIPEDGHRYEIIDGVLFMVPSPGAAHQSVSGLLVFHLIAHVQNPGLGRVFHAPFDVELNPRVVVQPDVVVILHDQQAIITPTRIIGAPDLVIEIASPSTSGYDRREKQNAYAAAGVREYWIADPATQTIEVLSLEQANYRTLGVFQGQAILPSKVLPTFPVQVARFFA